MALTAFMYALTTSSGRPWLVSLTKPWFLKLDTRALAVFFLSCKEPWVNKEKSSVGKSMAVNTRRGLIAINKDCYTTSKL